MYSDYNTHPQHQQVDDSLHILFEKYVPMSGKCDTVGGEMVRAISRIIYRWYNDGDIAGVGYGRETVNPSVRYLNAKMNHFDVNLKIITNVEQGWNNTDVYDYSLYEDALKVLKVLDEHPDLFEQPNTEDMYDYATSDDVDDCCDDWSDEF